MISFCLDAFLMSALFIASSCWSVSGRCMVDHRKDALMKGSWYYTLHSISVPTSYNCRFGWRDLDTNLNGHHIQGSLGGQ
ncbi:uncharacterized protein B0T15DRAFT_540321 [Chaetomium strumarium]|uniref:Secreted protein n=1 Tax=Chaetomium strumarium TaxID=1170767 RepID=A0AAJ0GP08_9PEZI|nr:hypothetical protein B0T15DRAFT_540321 [Chaetomium strumarium]